MPYLIERSTNLRKWLTLAVLTNSLGATALFDGTAGMTPSSPPSGFAGVMTPLPMILLPVSFSVR